MTICKDLLTNITQIVRLTERLPFVKCQIHDIFNPQCSLKIGAKKKEETFFVKVISPLDN